jgi:integrase
MARKLLMTWVPSERRWTKHYKGRNWSASCKQLKTAATKEASWEAANAWWQAKQKEIDTSPPDEQTKGANAFRLWCITQDWKNFDDETRQRLIDSLLGSGEYQKLKQQADTYKAAALQTSPTDRTVKFHVEAWIAFLRGACDAGQMSAGRFDAYHRKIRPFASWIGEHSAIDAIDEQKLEGFFSHLAVLVAARKYSPNYAHEILMTAKQFISRLAETKLIPLPGNIRSRRFKFNHSVTGNKETFTVEEVRQILAACDGFSERTKLYLLLMLNCGMMQNDIAELLKEEVHWSDGTITRARSKTRERKGPVVRYRLWPETFALLKKHRAKEGELALTTDEGNPLVGERLEGEDYRKYDTIRSAWSRLAGKMGVKKIRLGMKHLRKTSATLLAQHPQYKFYANHFLADSPRTVADRHYVTPNDEEFFLALEWLREQILGAEGG